MQLEEELKSMKAKFLESREDSSLVEQMKEERNQHKVESVKWENERSMWQEKEYEWKQNAQQLQHRLDQLLDQFQQIQEKMLQQSEHHHHVLALDDSPNKAQWEHDQYSTPEKRDPKKVLREIKEGLLNTNTKRLEEAKSSRQLAQQRLAEVSPSTGVFTDEILQRTERTKTQFEEHLRESKQLLEGELSKMSSSLLYNSEQRLSPSVHSKSRIK